MRGCWLGLVACAVLVGGASIVLAAGVITDSSQLIGAGRCGGCHGDQYEIWKKSPHARAFQVLDAHERRDARCYACHTTGLQSELDGVQCESCHGAGRHYAKVLVMRDPDLARMVGLQEPTLQTCNRCHTEDNPNIKPFKPAEKLDRIRHWRPGREPKAAPLADEPKKK